MRRAAVSMQRIADEVGVSKNAVSLALANKPGVGQEMRERVLEAASRLGYRKPREARPREARSLLVISPEYNLRDRFFYGDVYLGIQKQAQAAGHYVMLSGVSEAMLEAGAMPDAMGEADLAGVLAVGVLPRGYLAAILEKGAALVSIDNHYDDLAIDSVVSANQEGAFAAARHLIGLGHRDMGFIAPVARSSSFYERWQGFQKALATAGLAPDPRRSILDPWPLESLGKELGGLRRALQAMESLPTAFVCGNDELAFALITLLGEMGLSVPRDLSVVGFDDIDAARLFSPALSTYRAPRVQLGQEAVRALLSLPGDRGRGRDPVRRTIYGSFLPRLSSAPPRR